MYSSPKPMAMPPSESPPSVVTQKGIVLAFAEGRAANTDQAKNKLILKRSFDNGKTWGKPLLIAADGDNSLNNPCALVDSQSGRILLMFQRVPAHLKEKSKAIETGFEGPNVYRNFLITSEDEGETWSTPADITRATKHATAATTICSGPGIGIELTRGDHKGRFIFPFNEGPYGVWNDYTVYSDDRGKTWNIGQIVPGALIGTKSQINEVQMVELHDGAVMLNSRQFAGEKHRKTATSKDGGETWSTIEDIKELADPSCMGSIFRYSFADETQPGLIIYSGPDSAKRENGTLYLSKDDGKTWPIKRSLVPKSFAYSVLTRLHDGQVGCLFETDGKIVFSRFSIDWIQAK